MDAKPIIFTEQERSQLYTSVISMHIKLEKDKYISQEAKDFWWKMGEKLRKAQV